MNELGMKIYHIRIKLDSINPQYGFILSDLDSIEEILDKLRKQFNVEKSVTLDEYLLQLMAVHVLIISLFEYTLKIAGKNIKQSKMPDYIRNCDFLNELEKDWFIYLILIRHTIVHNFGHYDKYYDKNVRKHIKKLKIDISDFKHSLSPLGIEDLRRCLNIVKKIIFLDIMSKHLTSDDIDDIKKYYNW
jgi:hypothetical protein